MLQIADGRERALVAVADAGLRLATSLGRRRERPARESIRRILVLRLERIGDLLMSLPALHALRERAPHAAIDLVVGSWNEALARCVPGIDRVETMDAPWLSRGQGGSGFLALARQARSWRARRYDLAINLEGDIRSNILTGLSGARWTAGFGMAGGGPILDCVAAFDPRSHTAINGVRLISAAWGEDAGTAPPPIEGRDAATRLPRPALAIPASAAAEADRLLGAAGPLAPGRPLVGLQVGAGRAIKEWPAERLAAVGAWAASTRGATIVLTGSSADRAAAGRIRAGLPAGTAVVDLAGTTDLLVLAAVLARLSLFITPDTGPMHLAAAVGTPLVGIFGPSSPQRWGPLSSDCRIVRIDLPCSPCNRIRNPPARCQGHTPDCLEGIPAQLVIAAAGELWQAPRPKDVHGPR